MTRGKEKEKNVSLLVLSLLIPEESYFQRNKNEHSIRCTVRFACYVAIEAASACIESYCPSPSPGNTHQQTEHKSLACCSIPCSTDKHDTVPDSVETRWPPTRWSAWPSQVTSPLFSQHKLITRSLSSVELTISSWAFLLQELLRELRKSLQQERGSNVSAMLAPAVYQVLSISERD